MQMNWAASGLQGMLIKLSQQKQTLFMHCINKCTYGSCRCLHVNPLPVFIADGVVYSANCKQTAECGQWGLHCGFSAY